MKSIKPLNDLKNQQNKGEMINKKHFDSKKLENNYIYSNFVDLDNLKLLKLKLLRKILKTFSGSNKQKLLIIEMNSLDERVNELEKLNC